MELARRPRGDAQLPPGALLDLCRRLRAVAGRHELHTVIACAFDHRTRMLPFIYADVRTAPAGVRAIGAALADIGCERTRIVLQQWSPRFRPSEMRLDGRVPDLFLVSSMRIHAAACDALLHDVGRIDPAQRPLVIVGGPQVIYEPWSVFGADATRGGGADVAVTGEEYVFLQLLEVLLAERGRGETLRSTFYRARDRGLLDDVAGLVYSLGASGGPVDALVDTGPQRLLVDLDEQPHPELGYRLLEAPSRRTRLAARALPDGQVGRHSPIGSLVLTLGCRLGCDYCPIPAYNQRLFRSKSGPRVADEMVRLHDRFGIRFFFGADDNFLNDHERALGIVETLARTRVQETALGHHIRWGTEATVHDVLAMRHHLRTVRKGGLRALWMGVEDMTGALVRKGQTPDKTVEAFARLRERGILPMPMLMHHDDQPLVSRGDCAGLLNQVRRLRKAGAVTVQVLMITPAPGSRSYEEAFTSGLVVEQARGRRAEPYMFDGNYVVASGHRQPWRRQLNILLAYLYFYNPLRFLWSLVRPKARLYLADCGAQLLGMMGLLQTARRTWGWAWRLWRGPLRRSRRAPVSSLPIRPVEAEAPVTKD